MMPRILISFLGAILDNKNKFTANLHIIKGYMSNSAVHVPFYPDCSGSLKLKELNSGNSSIKNPNR